MTTGELRRRDPRLPNPTTPNCGANANPHKQPSSIQSFHPSPQISLEMALESLLKYFDWRAFLVLPIVLVIWHLVTRDSRRKSLPPRVRGWPIINQTFLQVKDDPTGLLRQWAREYGEIFMTKSGTTTFIWLNSMESVKELFDRRSNIYSDRQPMPMALDYARYTHFFPSSVSCGKRVYRSGGNR